MRYRYYVSRALQHEAKAGAEGLRIPAREIEAAVIQTLVEALDDPFGLLARAGIVLESDRLRRIFAAAERLGAAVRSKQHDPIRALIARITVHPRQLSIELSVAGVCEALDIEPTHSAAETIALPHPFA